MVPHATLFSGMEYLQPAGECLLLILSLPRQLALNSHQRNSLTPAYSYQPTHPLTHSPTHPHPTGSQTHEHIRCDNCGRGDPNRPPAPEAFVGTRYRLLAGEIKAIQFDVCDRCYKAAEGKPVGIPFLKISAPIHDERTFEDTHTKRVLNTLARLKFIV